MTVYLDCDINCVSCINWNIEICVNWTAAKLYMCA